MNEPYIQTLRDTIQKTHGCISRYVKTVAVKEQIKGQPAWEGNVEVFDLAGHAQARQCYAWAYKGDDGRRQFAAILNPPIKTPGDAVRDHLIRESQKKPPQ